MFSITCNLCRSVFLSLDSSRLQSGGQSTDPLQEGAGPSTANTAGFVRPPIYRPSSVPNLRDQIDPTASGGESGFRKQNGNECSFSKYEKNFTYGCFS